MTLEEKNEAKAILVIRNYLNKNLSDEYIKKNYTLAIEQLIENANKINSSKLVGVKSMSEGNQSVSFDSNIEAWSITADVKALLPTPYVRMY
ncbi:hypothetical protein [Romboutsia sp. 1001713B170207_170306_H8]|uniref:hypothetical protein n=1 Tax=Romboutsia sp. 1001713B170207_170306_H8 TaxID=2787112 RepID=UPI00189892CC|nr:hypothetical protein [Romboutsia sp. 1001713B170207_170306_H8]